MYINAQYSTVCVTPHLLDDLKIHSFSCLLFKNFLNTPKQ